MMLIDYNFVLQNMDDVRVIPDRFCRQHTSTHFHPIQSIVVHAVQTDQRTLVISERVKGIQGACCCAIVLMKFRIQGVDIDTDYSTGIIAEGVVDNDRL